jgi:hypothetical protein
VIKTIHNQQLTYHFGKLIINYFEEPRHPGLGQFFDFSRTRKGFQSLQNRLLFMQSVNFDWNNNSNELSDDHLRIELKKAFFPYIDLAETTKKLDQ